MIVISLKYNQILNPDWLNNITVTRNTWIWSKLNAEDIIVLTVLLMNYLFRVLKYIIEIMWFIQYTANLTQMSVSQVSNLLSLTKRLRNPNFAI